MSRNFLCAFFALIMLEARAQTDSLDIKIGQMILIGMPLKLMRACAKN